MRKRPISDPWWWGGLLSRRNELTDPPQAEVVVPRALKSAGPEFCSRRPVRQAQGRRQSAGVHCQRASSGQSAALSPPPLPFHILRLELRVLLRPQAGGQVLPAAVGEEGDDVAALHPRGDPLGGAQDGARGYAREDAFVVHELLHGCEGGERVHYDPPVQQGLVEDGGDEPLLQAAQPLDEVARVGGGGDRKS